MVGSANSLNISGAGIPVFDGSQTFSTVSTTNHGIVVGLSTNSIASLGVAANGQLPIGSAGANPVLATITQGTNITITNGAGTIQLDVAAGGGLTLGTFGSTPNSNGLSLTTGVLNMQPADGTNPGGISTTTQNIAGNKIFNTSATSGSFLSLSGGGGIATIQYPSSATSFNFNMPTTAGTTGYFLTSAGGGSTNMTWTNPSSLPQGTVTSVSVVSANGFAGTVATSTTTPAITLSTTVTGILTGNGTAITGSAVTQHGVLVGGASNAVSSTAVGTTGQVLQGNTGADPTWGSPAASSISLTGDTGGALTGAAFIIKAGTSTVNSGASVGISGSGTTLTLNVSDGSNNMFVGSNSGNTTLTSTNCTAFGTSSCHALTSGSNNISFGRGSLVSLLTGSFNICLGDQSGSAYTGAESSNIQINSSNGGTVGESNVLRIGNGTGTGNGQQNKAFISGITGITVVSAVAMGVTSSNQIVSASPLTNSGQPAFFAYLNTTATNATGDNTSFKPIFDVKLFDNATNYSTSTGAFTAPVTGHYIFNCAVFLTGVSGTFTAGSLSLVTTTNTYLSNTISPIAVANVNGFYQMHASWGPIPMTAADTALINVLVSNGTKTVSVNSSGSPYQTYFSGCLLAC